MLKYLGHSGPARLHRALATVELHLATRATTPTPSPEKSRRLYAIAAGLLGELPEHTLDNLKRPDPAPG